MEHFTGYVELSESISRSMSESASSNKANRGDSPVVSVGLNRSSDLSRSVSIVSSVDLPELQTAMIQYMVPWGLSDQEINGLFKVMGDYQFGFDTAQQNEWIEKIQGIIIMINEIKLRLIGFEALNQDEWNHKRDEILMRLNGVTSRLSAW